MVVCRRYAVYRGLLNVYYIQLDLYKLGDEFNPTIDVFPRLICRRESIHNEKILPDLMESLNQFCFSTPLGGYSPEATRSLYVHCFLSAVVVDSMPTGFIPTSELEALESNLVIKPEKIIKGVWGKGPVDYAIDLCNGVTVGRHGSQKGGFQSGRGTERGPDRVCFVGEKEAQS